MQTGKTGKIAKLLIACAMLVIALVASIFRWL